MVDTTFDWQAYVNKYPDLQAAGIDTPEEALNHWTAHGQGEGRTYTPALNAPTVNNSPQIAADFQKSLQGSVYDINGNPLTLPDGYKFGGDLFANTIFDAQGHSAGQYYNSPEDAALWRQRTQDTMNGTAVAGPQTLEQQRAQISQNMSTNGLSQGLYNALQNPTYGVGGPALVPRNPYGQQPYGQQPYDPYQQQMPYQMYDPYGAYNGGLGMYSQQMGYNPFGSQYGFYNPFGNQYNSYVQQEQPTNPHDNFTPAMQQNYDMGFGRTGQMPQFGPLSQMQASMMYA